MDTKTLTLDTNDVDDLNYFLNMVIEDCVQSDPYDMERVIELLNKINQ